MKGESRLDHENKAYGQNTYTHMFGPDRCSNLLLNLGLCFPVAWLKLL